MKDERRRDEDFGEIEDLVASFAPVRPHAEARERILAPARREERQGATAPVLPSPWHPRRWVLAWERFCNGLGELVFAGRWGLATTVILFALNCAVDGMPARLLETRGLRSVMIRRHGQPREKGMSQSVLGGRPEGLLEGGGAGREEKDRNG